MNKKSKITQRYTMAKIALLLSLAIYQRSPNAASNAYQLYDCGYPPCNKVIGSIPDLNTGLGGSREANFIPDTSTANHVTEV